MDQFDQRKTGFANAQFKSTAIMLAFGLIIILLLVAMDRVAWFQLRPASGTAVAMSKAATRTVPDAAILPSAPVGGDTTH